MLVSFASAVFDPLGYIALNALPDSELTAAGRRVTRTATLDGNAALVDNGFTSADSTITVQAYLEPAAEATLQRLIRLYPEIICATQDGCYTGVIESVVTASTGRTLITFLPTRALATRYDT